MAETTGRKLRQPTAFSLREWAQPFLEEGEVIQSLFVVRTGVSPRILDNVLIGPLVVLSMLVDLLTTKWRLVVTTDRNTVVLKAGRGLKPRKVLARLPRQQFPRPQGKRYGALVIEGKRYWVPSSWFDAVAAPLH